MHPVVLVTVGTNDNNQKMLLLLSQNLKGASGWPLFDGHKAVKSNKNADNKS